MNILIHPPSGTQGRVPRVEFPHLEACTFSNSHISVQILQVVGLICTPVRGCEISYSSSFHSLLGLSDTIFTQTDGYEMIFHFY